MKSSCHKPIIYIYTVYCTTGIINNNELSGNIRSKEQWPKQLVREPEDPVHVQNVYHAKALAVEPSKVRDHLLAALHEVWISVG